MRNVLSSLFADMQTRRTARGRLMRPLGPVAQREPLTPVPVARASRPVAVDDEELAMFEDEEPLEHSTIYVLRPFLPEVLVAPR